jgi:hypothetical protein
MQAESLSLRRKANDALPVATIPPQQIFFLQVDYNYPQGRLSARISPLSLPAARLSGLDYLRALRF